MPTKIQQLSDRLTALQARVQGKRAAIEALDTDTPVEAFRDTLVGEYSGSRKLDHLVL